MTVLPDWFSLYANPNRGAILFVSLLMREVVADALEVAVHSKFQRMPSHISSEGLNPLDGLCIRVSRREAVSAN
jgi:hypothetical protein